MRWKIS